MRSLLFSLCILSVLSGCKKNDKKSDSTPVGISDKVLTESLSQPWEIVWGPDNFIWMTERGGRVSRVNPESGAVSPLLTISDVRAQGEGGLLGLALHPSFGSTPQVFVAYNYQAGAAYREKIVRFTYSGNTLTDPVTLLDNLAASGNHNGCRLLIVGDKLFITTGDASEQDLSQNSGSLNGKVLRINLDGSIPGDNPIGGSAIWSIGHRNAQGLVFAHNRLFSSEHGPDSDDEINIIEKGRNYGWPTVKGVCEGGEQSFCSANNVKEPIKIWTPTIAPSGMEYYEHDLLPQWKHSLLVATLKHSRLLQLKLNGSHDGIAETNEFFANKYGRLRDLCIAPDGRVFFCTGNGSNDKIIVVTKAP
ncbi:PQQ-dependent sugar dehydrogenase [Paraflavitalea sp. CAU 1676]|uniref:PQQ-dependent sugar dehydrogenase n=1 Tax=Paraflavitalea sp. CAU 1676 TaxID=3032598 RepID=UPI0023DBF667|nr:PQQ-dependent sugar dehydrogenase [Paraflavitalea sp. CAU 1676]MDF2193732.1 PQQ-dependent sugar dehydrogenase [Paraflavitalea sp. CAU 1676]